MDSGSTSAPTEAESSVEVPPEALAEAAVAVIEAQAEADVTRVEAATEAQIKLIEAQSGAVSEAHDPRFLEMEGKIKWLEEKLESIGEALVNLAAGAAPPSTPSPSSETTETTPPPETETERVRYSFPPEAMHPAVEDGQKANHGRSKRKLRFL